MDHVEAVIDLDTIAGNVAALRRHVAGPAVMAVVKSDGYGHGLVPAARAAVAAGAEWLGVNRVAEALALRDAGLATRVLCLMALAGDAHEEGVRRDVDLPAGTTAMVERVAAAARRAGRPARLHLKVDTGMARGGATAADWPGVVAAARRREAAGEVVIAGLWSHLACADVPGHPSVPAQLAAFRDALAVAERAGVKPEVRHLANTAAALALPQTWFDLVRPGGGVFGLATLPGGPPPWLRPAMTVHAPLAQVKHVPAGTAVSYGHRYRTPRAGTLGLVPLGYAEGVPRDASGVVQVQARGRRWGIAGTVCMNQFVIDFGDGQAAEGDDVVLFGPGDDGEPTAQEWAEALGTISYEIVTGFADRLPRSYREVACRTVPVHVGVGPWPPGGGNPPAA